MSSSQLAQKVAMEAKAAAAAAAIESRAEASVSTGAMVEKTGAVSIDEGNAEESGPTISASRRNASSKPPSKKNGNKPPPGRGNFELSAEDRRALNGQLYAYVNRLARNPDLSRNYDEDKLRSLMFALADVFSDCVAGVKISFAQQTELENRYGAYPILTARIDEMQGEVPWGATRPAELDEDLSKNVGASRGTALAQMRSLFRQASEAASLAASIASEAIIIAEHAKKLSRASVPMKMAWNKRLGELRVSADQVKKAGYKTDASMRLWDKRHRKKLYHHSGRKRGRAEGGDIYAHRNCENPPAVVGEDGTTESVSAAAPADAVGVNKAASACIAESRGNIPDKETHGMDDACKNNSDETGCNGSRLSTKKPTGDFSSLTPFTALPGIKKSTRAQPAPTGIVTRYAMQLAKERKVARPPLSWEERFQHLLHFKSGYGHCLVPINYSTDETPGLGQWVSKMRAAYTEWGKLSPQERHRDSERNQRGAGLTKDRLARLDAEGFQWRVVTKQSWEQRMEHLRAFKMEHGHTMVPRSYAGGLGEWCKHQRMKRKVGDLDTEKVKDLETLGFDWSAAKGTEKKPWHERFEMLVEFRRRYGHCDAFAVECETKGGETGDEEAEEGKGHISSDYVRKLRNWSRLQRRNYRDLISGRKSTLDKMKIKKLEDIGFEWRVQKLRKSEGFDNEGELE